MTDNEGAKVGAMQNLESSSSRPFIFEDPVSQSLLRSIDPIALSDATVLITGETGTGKEIVARHVHASSRRRASPFIAINCSALPEALVESELFGHERGAFTGATSSKAGWFECADGGTLLLDEVGELPLAVQAKLLRVLQESEVVRIGSRRPIPIDVRIVAATNVGLEEAVAARRFRQDLYYRLHVAPLLLAPLRDRPGDIVPLGLHFIDLHGGAAQRALGLTEVAQRRLLVHRWPGNVRELENVIRHALLLCDGRAIGAPDLRFSSGPLARVVDAAPQVGALPRVLEAMFEQNLPGLHHIVEQTLFSAAYRYCHRNQLATARLLGVSRNVVRARLVEAGELSAPSVERPSVARAAGAQLPSAAMASMNAWAEHTA